MKDLSPVPPIQTKYIGKKYREAKGYTVRDLASKTYIAPSTITKWENQHTVPNLDCLIIVARALDVEPSMLYEIEEAKIFKSRRV